MTKIAKTDSVSYGVISRIQIMLSALTRREQEVANYVLTHPDVVYQSVTEVARRSGAGLGSVVRFCQRLGFLGFQDFKIHLASDLAAQAAEGQPGRNDSVQHVADQLTAEIRSTLNVLTRNELRQAAKLLARSKFILAAGCGGSAVVAQSLMYRLSRLGLASQAECDGHMQAIRAASMGRQDAAFLVSFSGSTREIIHTAGILKQRGCRIICLTNFIESPVTELADVVLLTSVHKDPLKAETVSPIAMMYVLEVLLNELAGILPDGSQAVERTFQAVSDRQL
jgi:DNA-binding MurR/RpiR family transcriptional regulator